MENFHFEFLVSDWTHSQIFLFTRTNRCYTWEVPINIKNGEAFIWGFRCNINMFRFTLLRIFFNVYIMFILLLVDYFNTKFYFNLTCIWMVYVVFFYDFELYLLWHMCKVVGHQISSFTSIVFMLVFLETLKRRRLRFSCLAIVFVTHISSRLLLSSSSSILWK